MNTLHALGHAAVVDLNGHGHYLQWGILQISYANATVIALMILVFALALVLPFPGHAAADANPTDSGDDSLGTDSGPRS